MARATPPVALVAGVLLGGIAGTGGAAQAAAPSEDHSPRIVLPSSQPKWGKGTPVGVNPDFNHPAPGQKQTARIAGHQANDVVSGNWAGLVENDATTQSYTAVSADWTVPTVPATPAGVSSTWIGIDGYTNQDLIQTGTEQDSFDGPPNYYAWYELLPNSEMVIGAVNPGDEMSANIFKDASPPNTWTIDISDTTLGVSFSQNFSYATPQTSAEWIEEMTSVTPKQPPLANFDTADFTDLSYTTSDPSNNVSTFVSMADSHGDVIAYPTQSDPSDLAVHYGNSQTSVTTSATGPVGLGDSVNYSASVTTGVTGMPTPNGSVTFSTGSTVLCTVALSGGTGMCSSSAAPAGTDTITGTYSGDSVFTASTGSTSIVVTPATPSFNTSIDAPSAGQNSWTDSATLTGISAGGAPTGSVSFTWCEAVSPSTSCTGTGGGGTAGTFGSPSVSGDSSIFGPSNSVSPSSVGTYCFNADYSATVGGNYASVSQQTPPECFSVITPTPGLTTSINAPPSTVVGNSWTDSATVAGNSTGGAPTGSVAFTWCKVVSPSTSCTGSSGGGTAGTSSPQSVAGDSSTFGPSSSITPGSVGTYCFNAAYSRTPGGYYASVSQQTDTECFTVTAANPTSFTTTINAPGDTSVGNSWTDSATVTGISTGGAPTGSVTFTWCKVVSPSTSCTGTSGGGTAGTFSSPTVGGDSSTFGPSNSARPSSAGTYCFDANYSANAGGYYTSVSQQTDPECFTVTAPPPPPPPPQHGYWLVGSDGGIFTFGSAQFYGSTGSLHLQRPVVGIVPTVDRSGYWLDASDGGIFAFGDAGFYGSIPGLGLNPAGSGRPNSLNAPIVGMVPSADGGGYFMVASDGGVFAFGDAHFAGSCPGSGGCAGAAVAVMPDASGNGYWVVTQSGNVYTFGDAPYYGAPGAQGAPVTSAVRTPDGHGYLILLANGAIFNYGDAGNFGSPAGQMGGLDPATAIFTTSDGGGYWVAAANGAVANYGDAPNDGSMLGTPLNGSIIAATGW